MIENELQYQVTKRWLRRFNSSLKLLKKQEASEELSPLLLELNINSCKAQIENFEEEISVFEKTNIMRTNSTSSPLFQKIVNSYVAGTAEKLMPKEGSTLGIPGVIPIRAEMIMHMVQHGINKDKNFKHEEIQQEAVEIGEGGALRIQQPFLLELNKHLGPFSISEWFLIADLCE